jgi:hypothetical protein
MENVKKEETIIKDGMTTAELVKKTAKYVVQPPLVLDLMRNEPPKKEKGEDEEAYEKRLENHETNSEIFARIMNEAATEKIEIIHEKHKWVTSARMTAYLVCLVYAKREFVVAKEEEKGMERIRDLLDSSPSEKVASIKEKEKKSVDKETSLLLQVIRKVSLQQREITIGIIKKLDPEKYKILKKILDDEKITLTRDKRELGDGEIDPDEIEGLSE